ncbi:MAG: molecular chaperone DnaJ [Synechococcaceae bacterium WB9_2_112]|nr:molecular chaperone DnaJ [Synechococcaceae bacterium WB9_2_112]
MNARWLKIILIGLLITASIVLLRAGMPLIVYLLGVIAAVVLFIERILLISSFFERVKGQKPVSQDVARMKEDEARDILGVGKDATAQDIEAAHQRLIMKNHPDQGGSTYLASKINTARDTLLDLLLKK